MNVFSDSTDPRVASLLRQGAVGVIPTDTLYGIVAVADSPQSVERVYDLRERNQKKACIVLVGQQQDITDRAAWTDLDRSMVERYWPGRVSIILPAVASPAHVHRGLHAIAYRLPDDPGLQQLLEQTGPLVAPSANIEGQPPATTIDEARAYFADRVDFYVDGGKLSGISSTLIKAIEGNIIVLRQGAVTIEV